MLIYDFFCFIIKRNNMNILNYSFLTLCKHKFRNVNQLFMDTNINPSILFNMHMRQKKKKRNLEIEILNTIKSKQSANEIKGFHELNGKAS